jgi:hypothetical protein
MIPEKTGSLLLVPAVSISLEFEDEEDEAFRNITTVLPLPQNGKIIRSQAHKALASRFREILDQMYSDEEFWINGLTAVSTLAPDETGEDENEHG